MCSAGHLKVPGALLGGRLEEGLQKRLAFGGSASKAFHHVPIDPSADIRTPPAQGFCTGVGAISFGEQADQPVHDLVASRNADVSWDTGPCQRHVSARTVKYG